MMVKGFCLPGSSAEGAWSSATSSYTAVSSAVSGANGREGGEETINTWQKCNNDA